jgi:hypothetical protein
MHLGPKGVFLAARVKAATEFLAGGLTKRGVPGALDASLCRLASMDLSHALWIHMIGNGKPALVVD